MGLGGWAVSLQVGNGTRVTFEQAHLQPQGLEPQNQVGAGAKDPGTPVARG